MNQLLLAIQYIATSVIYQFALAHKLELATISVSALPCWPSFTFLFAPGLSLSTVKKLLLFTAILHFHPQLCDFFLFAA